MQIKKNTKPIFTHRGIVSMLGHRIEITDISNKNIAFVRKMRDRLVNIMCFRDNNNGNVSVRASKYIRFLIFWMIRYYCVQARISRRIFCIVLAFHNVTKWFAVGLSS